MVKDIIDAMGGRENIVSVTNCMTRLRFVVVNESSVKEAEMKELPDVLGLVHDMPMRYEVVVGPGKSTKYASECHQAGIPAAAEGAGLSSGQSWEENKKAVKSARKQSGLNSFLKIFGDVFVPLIPGTIAAGLCAGFAILISQAVPEYESKTFWLILYQLLSLINTAFMTYITAWAGYRASERFGGTPILGGMLGMITSQEGINTASKALGYVSSAICWFMGRICISEIPLSAPLPDLRERRCFCLWWLPVCTTVWWRCTRYSWSSWALSRCTPPLPWRAPVRWARASPFSSRPAERETTDWRVPSAEPSPPGFWGWASL